MRVGLKTHRLWAEAGVAFILDRERARRQQPVGLQLLATQADDHQLAAEVRFSEMLRSVRIGISAPGASMATPQP